MAYLSKDLAENYYDNILRIHQLKNSLKNKVPALKNELEEILAEITGINNFTGKNGQKIWLVKNKIKRSNGKATSGDIPEDIVEGIINLFAGRNKAEHDKVMDYATYMGYFALMAKAISFFSDTQMPEEIQAICDGKNPEITDTPVQTRAKNQKKTSDVKPKFEESQIKQSNQTPEDETGLLPSSLYVITTINGEDARDNKKTPPLKRKPRGFNTPPYTWDKLKQEISNGKISRKNYIYEIEIDSYTGKKRKVTLPPYPRIDKIPDLALCFDEYENRRKKK